MKVTVEVDCTPEEGRRFLGVVPMQRAAMAKLQQRMESAVEASTPEAGATEGVDANGARSDAAGVRQAVRCLRGIEARRQGLTPPRRTQLVTKSSTASDCKGNSRPPKAGCNAPLCNFCLAFSYLITVALSATPLR